MQKGILLKDGSDILAKEVYGGNITSEIMDAVIAAMQLKYPTYTIILFESDEDSEFTSAIVNRPLGVE